MHFVTGGAYNGKANWVKNHYQLDRQNNTYTWISAYKKEQILEDYSLIKTDFLILEGLEQWTFQWKMDRNEVALKEFWKTQIKRWSTWEQENPSRKLILIGVDISKGIVPMEPEMRAWRDMTGYFYQDIVKKSSRFDLIWYGIAKQLK